MSKFKRLYEASKDAMKLAMLPINERQNKRAFESAIDSAEQQKIDAESEILKIEQGVANGVVIDVNQLLKYRQIVKNAENTISILEEEKAAMFDSE